MTKKRKKQLKKYYFCARSGKTQCMLLLVEKSMLDEQITEQQRKLKDDPSVENAVKLIELVKRSDTIEAVVRSNPIFLEPIIVPKATWENRGRLPIDIKVENHTQRRIKLALTWEYLPESYSSTGDESIIIQRQVEEEVKEEERASTLKAIRNISHKVMIGGIIISILCFLVVAVIELVEWIA